MELQEKKVNEELCQASEMRKNVVLVSDVSLEEKIWHRTCAPCLDKCQKRASESFNELLREFEESSLIICFYESV